MRSSPTRGGDEVVQPLLQVNGRLQQRPPVPRYHTLQLRGLLLQHALGFKLRQAGSKWDGVSNQSRQTGDVLAS